MAYTDHEELVYRDHLYIQWQFFKWVKDHILQSILFNRISLIHIIIYNYKYIKIFYLFFNPIYSMCSRNRTCLQWMLT